MSAFFAFYTSGCHVDYDPDQTMELVPRVTLETGIHQFGLANQLKPLRVEAVSNALKNIVGIHDFAISDNLKFPNREKAKELSLASLARLFGFVLAVPGVATNGEEVAENRSNEATAQKGSDGLQKTFCGFVWHFSLAVFGGLTGYAGITAFRGWRSRREVELPEPSWPNTTAFYMTPINRDFERPVIKEENG